MMNTPMQAENNPKRPTYRPLTQSRPAEFKLLICMILLLRVLPSSASVFNPESYNEKIPIPNFQQLEPIVVEQLKAGRLLVLKFVNNPETKPEDKAKSIYDLALLYHAYDLRKEAKQCYNLSLSLAPHQVDCAYALGYLDQMEGNFEEALTCYQTINPDLLSKPYHYLITIRLGECFRSLNRPQQAQEQFQIALNILPNGAAALARMGELALGMREFQKAVDCLSEALRLQPEANKLNYPLALAYRSLGDMAQAREYLSKRGTVGIQPPDPLKTKLDQLIRSYRVHVLDGRLAFAAGHYSQAAASFKKAIDADPSQEAARINYGVSLFEMRQYREALDSFQAVYKMNSSNITVLYNMGVCNFLLGDSEKAVFFLSKLIELKPKDALAQYYLARSFLNLQDAKGAFDHLTMAIKTNPSLSDAWIYLSTLFSIQGQYPESLRILEEAHSRLPHDPAITHALARILCSTPAKDLRNASRAISLAKQALQAKQTFEYAKTLALACAEANRCSEANSWIQQSIQMAKQENCSPEDLNKLLQLDQYFRTHNPCGLP